MLVATRYLLSPNREFQSTIILSILDCSYPGFAQISWTALLENRARKDTVETEMSR